MTDICYANLHEPVWSIEQETLPEGEYYVLAWIKLDPIEFVGSEGRNVYEFPLFSCEHKVTTPSEHRFFHLYAAAQRIRNYLAFQFGMQIPVVCKFVGRDYLDDIFMDSDFSACFLLSGLRDQNPEQVWQRFVSGYERVKELLAKCDPFYDKIINLYGSSLWSEDITDSYLCRWKIIEMVANKEAKRLRSGEASDFEEILKGRTGTLDKIRMVLRKLVPERDIQDIGKCCELRNRIAHGAISSEAYEMVYECDNIVAPIARDLARMSVSRI
jgi:hypothetical protein